MRIETLDMRQNIFTIKQSLPKLSAFCFWILAFSFLLFAFTGCKKAGNFYEKLQALPQLDNTSAYAYKPAYIIGDTMVIIGKLYPKNHLQISIGGKNANIIKTDSIKDNHDTWLDRAYLPITADMEGKSKEVKIISSNYSILGANIDVYTTGGPGSFEKELKSVLIKSFTNGGQNVFLHCQNGKGDVYYYAAASKDLRHITKEGTESIIYNLAGSLTLGGTAITSFLAGGIDPQGQNLYFSARTSPSDYVFCKIDLIGNQLTILNQSQIIAAPYEGAIGSVKMTISGIYPDSKGNVYLGIGFNQKEGGTVPNAIARYSSLDGRVSYIYKNLINGSPYAGMPGTSMIFSSNIVALRFSPDETLLYALEKSLYTTSAVMEVFDMDARVKLHDFSTENSTNSISKQLNVIAPFAGLQINMGTGAAPDQSFGYLPMPGKRLQVLLFQYFDGGIIGHGGINIAEQYGFPKWVVFDFAAQRTYAYAPGRFDQNSYIFQPTNGFFPRSSIKDELLNYDENGNLYTTVNGKAVLIRTQPVN